MKLATRRRLMRLRHEYAGALFGAALVLALIAAAGWPTIARLWS